MTADRIDGGGHPMTIVSSITDDPVCAVVILRVPRRSRWLPRWAWYVEVHWPHRVQRTSGYTRTWWGASLRVGRLVRAAARDTADAYGGIT
jgi:hypothetical protein